MNPPHKLAKRARLARFRPFGAPFNLLVAGPGRAAGGSS
jgi:hypothetical protein